MLKAVVTLGDHLSVVLGLSHCVTVSECVTGCPSILWCNTVSQGVTLQCLSVSQCHSVCQCHGVRSSVCGCATVTLWCDHTDHLTQLPKVLSSISAKPLPTRYALVSLPGNNSLCYNGDQTGQKLQKTLDCRPCKVMHLFRPIKASTP